MGTCEGEQYGVEDEALASHTISTIMVPSNTVSLELAFAFGG